MILEEITEILENFITTLIHETKNEKTLLKNNNITDDKHEIKMATEYMKLLKEKIENPNNNLIITYEEYILIDKTNDFINNVIIFISEPKLTDYKLFIENYNKFKYSIKDNSKYMQKYFDIMLKDKSLFQKTSYFHYKEYIEVELGNYNNFKLEDYKKYILGKLEGF